MMENEYTQEDIISTDNTSNKRKRKKELKAEIKRMKKKKRKIENGKIQKQAQFSVDMSAQKNGTVKIKEIQSLLLSSLVLSEETLLPNWATLDASCIKRVVVVLFKYVTAQMFAKNEDCMTNLATMFDVVFPFQNEGHHVFVESPAHSLLSVSQTRKKKEDERASTKPLSLHAKDYILTENELIQNDFIIPGLSEGSQDFCTVPSSFSTEASCSSQLFALDCEMCMSSKGRELTRISVVDSAHQVVYDTFVKPENPITDYLTRFSGITAKDLEDVSTTLRDVQKKLKKLIPADAILVGHSLEFDFTSLKFFHNKVIDTSVIYGDGRGMGFKPSLKYLAKKYLKEKIQENSDGHCSIEDARTCMRLAQLKITKGPQFGLHNVHDEISFFDHLHEQSSKKGVMVDRKTNIKQYSGCADSIPCSSDNEVVRNVIRVSSKYHFIWSQFHDMDSLHTDHKAGKKQDIKTILCKMDSNIAKIHENLPKGTLFVVLLGGADTPRIRKLREQGAESKIVKRAIKEIQHGQCFMKLKT